MPSELTALIRTVYPAYDGRSVVCPPGCHRDRPDVMVAWGCETHAHCLAHWRHVVWAAKRRRAYPTLTEVGL